MDYRSLWGRNIAAARRRLGISQTELGRRIPLRNQIAAHTVSRWERGVSTPTDKNRIRLAEILGVPAGDLFPYPDGSNGTNGDEEAA